MSANVDLARSIRAGWERGDYSSADWAHPDIEYVIADGPSPGTWIGVSAMAEGLHDWLSAWEDFRGEAEEYRELEGERVLVLVRRKGRGKTSGLEIGELRVKGATLFHFHDGKASRLVNYMDRDRAFADLGLSK